MASEVTALSRAYDLTLWVAERVARFPKAHHYTIGARMVNTLLEVQETQASSDEGRQRRLPHQSGKPQQRWVRRASAPVAQALVAQASVPASAFSAKLPPPMPDPLFHTYRRRLPHWRLSGATYFVTWRLASGQQDLTPSERTLLVQALKHFEHQRYELAAYVVMNDHVHVVVTPLAERRLEEILRSWKSYTARTFQRETGRHGNVWLVESFDRIVRDDAELLEKAQYILNNPRKRWPEIMEYPWVWVLGGTS